MTTLSRSERKSLAVHLAIATRLRADPALRDVARARLAWLRERNPASAPWYDAWAELLDGPLDRLLQTLADPGERACALRQENPFVDLVDQSERARIHRAVVAELDAEAHR